MEKIPVFDALIFDGWKYLTKNIEKPTAEVLREAQAEEAVILRNELAWLTPQRSIEIVNQMTASCQGAWGLYLMLPAITGETPPVSEQCKTFRQHRIAGYWLHPEEYGIPTDPVFLEDELTECEKRQIPVWFRIDRVNTLSYLVAILEKFPKLCVIVSPQVEWPDARKSYPLLRKYPNLHICISEEVWEGAITDMVRKFGAERLLYSSSFPQRYPGGTVMMVERAGITDEERDMIYGGNLRRLIGGMNCD